MRRWRAILLCLLAGAAVNVLVAWGCDLAWLGLRDEFSESGPPWSIEPPPILPDMEGFFISERGLGIEHQSWIMFGPNTPALVCIESGWPFRSLMRSISSGLRRDALGPYSGPESDTLRLPEWTPSRQTFRICGPAAVGLRPLWPGFAANTAMFAGALWVVFPAFGRFSRWRRRRRGLCPRCAYDLRGVTCGCPECGAQP